MWTKLHVETKISLTLDAFAYVCRGRVNRTFDDPVSCNYD